MRGNKTLKQRDELKHYNCNSFKNMSVKVFASVRETERVTWGDLHKPHFTAYSSFNKVGGGEIFSAQLQR